MVFIKKVLIQGFKSYKDQTIFDPFNEQVNVIVGRNGSGKSNFFSAIRFVLSDMFTNLDKEERQRLLHEGSGDTVLSAFVEIVFDNKDSRFPIDKEEVVLRRTIGLKKDEFILDKKRVTLQDVVNLLESAGFSRSNPYYIVQQGKVTALTLMRDSERLDLLKEVAGARVYDERRKQSLKLIEDSNGKQGKIEESLNYINQRLEELEEEKEEYRIYQKADKERRALEYNIYDKDLQQTLKELDSIEEERRSESTKANAIYESALSAREEVRDLDKQLKNINQQLSTFTKERDTTHQEKQDLIKEKAKLKLKVKDVQSKIDSYKQQQKDNRGEIKELDKSITKSEKELSTVTPKYEGLLSEEKKTNTRLEECNRRLTDLYAKQGRNAQFGSDKERDDFLKKEIAEIDKQINKSKEQISSLEKEIRGTRKVTSENDKELETLKERIEEKKQVIEATTKEWNEARDKRDRLQANRKDLWKRETEIDSNFQNYKNEMIRCARQLQTSVNKAISIGLQAVTRIKEQYNLSGIYGPIIELFDCDEEFVTAVEVAGGNNLFNVVVDTDDTAAKIIEILNQEKIATRLTFMPLNKLNVRPFKFPTGPSVMPMIDQLRPTTPAIQKALQQIFGKILICRDLETASSYSRSQNIDCITTEGDQVNKKGALTGGYYDIRTSRLETMKQIKKWEAKVSEITSESEKVKNVVKEIEERVNSVLSEMQELESTKNKNKSTYEQLLLEIKTRQGDQETYKDILDKKESLLDSLTTTLHQLEESRSSLHSEIGTKLLNKLTDKEQRELEQLKKEIEELKKELISISTERSTLESTKLELENLLNSNLRKRKQELTEQVESIQFIEQEQELQVSQSELDKIENQLTDINSRISVIDESVTTNNKRKKEIQDSLEDKKNTELNRTKALQKESERMEKLLNRRSLLIQKREESERKIREIGSLPSSEVEQFKQLNLKELLSKLHETNKKLKEYQNVNKKAMDQYMQFTEQKATLESKKLKLDESNKAILELIDTLDQRKEEAISRTYKGVAFHFSKIFEQLVPGGSGSIIMQKKSEEGKQNEFSGVAIKVKFASTDEFRGMNQLSGGQKSLVALALIFSIQKCDPAPFYLFDEIDSALDATYRTRVAKMIRKNSRNEVVDEEGKKKTEYTQFIISTFRPELVKAGHKCYAITVRDKESNISPIDQAEAEQIIQEQTGGEVTTTVASTADEEEVDVEEEEEEEQ